MNSPIYTQSKSLLKYIICRFMFESTITRIKVIREHNHERFSLGLGLSDRVSVGQSHI